MSKMLVYILGSLFLLGLAGVFTGCEDSPVRPKAPHKIPDCWSPLREDTVVFPPPVPSDAQASPVWSNSGELVAYLSFYDSCNVRDVGLYIADSGGGAVRRKISVFGAYCQWLPGDTELIVSTGFGGAGELVLYNLNTDSATPLGIHPRFPVFDVSRDGRYIYYEGEPAPPHRGSSIYEYDRTTDSEWAVVEGALPGISPDRTYLAYAAGPLFVYRFSDSTIRELAPSGGSPEWTPNGMEIVFDDAIGVVMSTDLSGNAHEITGEHSGRGAFGPISLSPDGTRLLYEQVSSDFFTHIWETDLDGSFTKQFSQ